MADEDDGPALDLNRPDNLVEVGSDGDPLPDPNSVRMFERESYERVIEGLKMAAEGASRCARMEKEHTEYWAGFRVRLDQIRRIVIQQAGIGDVIKFNETPISWGGDPGQWTDTRKQFREGIRQAAGGARQMATCQRLDPFWSTQALHLERMVEALNKASMETVRRARAQGSIWVPDSGLTT